MINRKYNMQWLSNEPKLPENTRNVQPDKMLGEICAFASELARLCEKGTAVPVNTPRSLQGNGKENSFKSDSKGMACQIFLGGSCNPTTWRSETAIPILQRLGITYYNPQVAEWKPELIDQEYEAKKTAKILFFVIDNQTRNSASFVEAAQLAATRSDSLIVVVYSYRLGQSISGETISIQEYFDLMNGLLVLHYLMKSHRVPVFESVPVALNCASKIIHEKKSVQDIYNEAGLRSARISPNDHKLDLTALRGIFKSLDVNDTGSISLREALVTLQANGILMVPVPNLYNVVNKTESRESYIGNFSANHHPVDQRINFEEFRGLASEGSWRAMNNATNCENWTNSFVSNSEKRDLYIGAEGKDQLCRDSIGLIESMGLSLYRMSSEDYNVRTLPQELQRMRNSRLILLIVPPQSRGISVMALAAYLIGLRTKLVLCVHTLSDDSTVSGEKLTEQAIKDYNRGRMYLSDYARREGVPVFSNLTESLQHALQLFQNSH